jgi:hypothetical protein
MNCLVSRGPGNALSHVPGLSESGPDNVLSHVLNFLSQDLPSTELCPALSKSGLGSALSHVPGSLSQDPAQHCLISRLV